MKKRELSEEINRIQFMMNIQINEQVSSQQDIDNINYVAVLGFISLYGVPLLKDPENREANIAIRNEVIEFCKNKRDGILPKTLSSPGVQLLNKINADITNRPDISELIKAGNGA